MTGVFWLIAAVMALLALAFVLRPLVRGGAPRDARIDALERARRDGVLSDSEFAMKRDALGASPSPPLAVPKPLVAVLALVVLAGSFGLYGLVGEPRAIVPGLAPSTTPPSLEAAAEGLAERLAKDPEDVEGWLLLGRAYKQTQRFAEARDALANAIRLAPASPDAMVEYAEALALAAPDRRLGEESRALLSRALELEPEHQRGLWLSGIASLQDERYEDAVTVWQRLLAQLPPESDVAESVREQIAQARARGGMPALAERVAAAPSGSSDAVPTPTAAMAPPSAPSTSGETASDTASAAASDTASNAGPKLIVEIALAPALAALVEPGDTLFVFARAPQGPKMPLAIQRLPVPSFPTTVVLDDSMGMLPALKLSQAPSVVVGVRISKSGNAAAQSGDLEVISAPLTVASQRGPVKLVIERIVP